MTDDQPTQPLTDAELSLIRDTYAKSQKVVSGIVGDPTGPYAKDCGGNAIRHVGHLLAEVDRLRSALTALGRNEQAAANRALELQEENERLRLELVQIESGAQIAMNAGVVALQEVKRLEKVCADLKEINDRMAADRTRLIEERDGWEDNATDTLRQLERVQSEATGTALGHLAKIERLQSQRDALVRKLGLDWGPDEFGDLNAVPDPSSGDVSDGYHTHNELYEYRMLYNAHAVRGWLDAGYRVVKSWHHSDGELCFGGGWFVVAAELPTGQVTNHYEADHWDLFVIPDETPPAYDGHSPAEAAHRLRQALGWGGDPVDS